MAKPSPDPGPGQSRVRWMRLRRAKTSDALSATSLGDLSSAESCDCTLLLECDDANLCPARREVKNAAGENGAPTAPGSSRKKGRAERGPSSGRKSPKDLRLRRTQPSPTA